MESLFFRDYAFENGQVVNPSKLVAERMPLEDYVKAHQGLIIPCHDIYLDFPEGILLVNRKGLPARNILWPIGGRILRGGNSKEPAEQLGVFKDITLDSLIKKVHEECGSGINIHDVSLIGVGRTMFYTAPFDHGKGTDTLNLIYYAMANGTIDLNNLHEKPTFVKKENYLNLRPTLHPYVQDGLDAIFS